MKQKLLAFILVLLLLTSVLLLSACKVVVVPASPETNELFGSGNNEPRTIQEVYTIADGFCGKGEDATGVKWELTSDGALTISGNGDMEDFYGYNADEITDVIPWYSYRSHIKKIMILSGVTTIGENAFAHCDKVISATIGDSVQYIANSSFIECDSLTSITIPSSVHSIGDMVFADCDNLSKIIVESANQDYCDIDGVLFSKDKTELLLYPNAHGSSYTVPDGVTEIWKAAFGRCYNLTNITVSEGVRWIEQNAFRGCVNLRTIDLPSTLESFGYYAIVGCDSLERITVSAYNPKFCDIDGVLFSKDGTCLLAYPNTHGSKYKIPIGVQYVCDDAFISCKSLKCVAIPQTLKSIEYQAFLECSSLTDVYYQGSASQWNSINISDSNMNLLDANLHFNYGY